MATTALKTASVLAFERKLDPSDALFASGSWALRDQASTWPAITVREKSVRGTISNRLKSAKDADPAKLDAAIQNYAVQVGTKMHRIGPPPPTVVDVASVRQTRDRRHR